MKTFNINGIHDIFGNILHKCSFLDFPSENSYHMLFNGFLSTLFYGNKNVGFLSNIESGHGRPDIKIEYKEEKRFTIIELKKSTSVKELDRDGSNAIGQIMEMEYFSGIENGYVLLIGVSFFGKRMSRFFWKELRFENSKLTVIREGISRNAEVSTDQTWNAEISTDQTLITETATNQSPIIETKSMNKRKRKKQKV